MTTPLDAPWWRKLLRGDRQMVQLLAFPGMIGYGVAVGPSAAGGLGCLWLWLFHVPCPACGLSRAVAALVRGHFVTAMHLHWFVIPLSAILLFLFAAETARLTRRYRHG